MSTKASSAMLASILGLQLTACGSGSVEPVSNSNSSESPSPIAVEDTAPIATAARFNQIGFYPGSAKVAVINNAQSDEFELTDNDGNPVFQGMLNDEVHWQASGESVRLADFSTFTTEGEYFLSLEGHAESDPVVIVQNAFSDLHKAALKYYYFNRSGFELTEEFAGQWQRDAGHPDTHVLVHESAASSERPEDTSIPAPMGWYDAGDFNKYIVNSGITTYTLLSAYEHFPDYFATETGGFIPESGNGLPDILDEALWNIRWMLAMQDPNDGGVYHKLTTKNFQAVIMPSQANADRYVVQKSTAASLDFAAVMAVTSRIFSAQSQRLQELGQNDLGLSELAGDALSAAKTAWQWAEAFPNTPYLQPGDITTGQYGDLVFNDEFAWAAAELFITTGEDQYYQAFKNYHQSINVPSFAFVDALGAISLLKHRETLSPAAEDDFIDGLAFNLKTLADDLAGRQQQSAYGITYGEELQDFVWGGNAVALNQSLILLVAYEHFRDEQYLTAALANLDYVLGRNPLALSYVTGMGERTPMFPHHRAAAADGVAEPIPGMLAGGAQPGQQDDCTYSSNLHALSYVDDFCSFSTNEVAINWNAPLSFVSAALDAILGNQ